MTFAVMNPDAERTAGFDQLMSGLEAQNAKLDQPISQYSVMWDLLWTAKAAWEATDSDDPADLQATYESLDLTADPDSPYTFVPYIRYSADSHQLVIEPEDGMVFITPRPVRGRDRPELRRIRAEGPSSIRATAPSSCSHEEPAVDGERDPRDVRGVVGCEEQGRVRHVLRRADPAKRYQRQERGVARGHPRPAHRRHEARKNAVHASAVPALGCCERSHQTADRGLGCRIAHVERVAADGALGRHRGDRDDRATPTAHQSRRSSEGEHRAEGVHIHEALVAV